MRRYGLPVVVATAVTLLLLDTASYFKGGLPVSLQWAIRALADDVQTIHRWKTEDPIRVTNYYSLPGGLDMADVALVKKGEPSHVYALRQGVADVLLSTNKRLLYALSQEGELTTIDLAARTITRVRLPVKDPARMEQFDEKTLIVFGRDVYVVRLPTLNRSF